MPSHTPLGNWVFLPTCSPKLGTITPFPIDFLPSHLKNISLRDFLSFPGASTALPCSSPSPKSAPALPILTRDTLGGQHLNQPGTLCSAQGVPGAPFCTLGCSGGSSPIQDALLACPADPINCWNHPVIFFFLDLGPSPGIGGQWWGCSCCGGTEWAESQPTISDGLVNTDVQCVNPNPNQRTKESFGVTEKSFLASF